MLKLQGCCIFAMDSSIIDDVISSLREHPGKRCFARELNYLGPEIRGFLSCLNPEAEIALIAGDNLFSSYGECDEEELWSWNPETGWYQVLTDDALVHPWEHNVLGGVDPLSTLGGIDYLFY